MSYNTESNQLVVRFSHQDLSSRSDSDLLVVLHGYGADETDLLPLTAELPDTFTVAAVRAPIWLTNGMNGYAWFPITEDLSSPPESVRNSLEQLDSWIQSVADGFRTVSILGFSQGMAMATSMLRMRPDQYAAVVGLSGFVLDASNEPLLAELLSHDEELATKQVPVFWGRDLQDPIIPPEMAEDAGAWLDQHVDLTQDTYQGVGHGVHPQEISDLTAFLVRHVANRR
ncbi:MULTISPECIES: alpha/beta hydrolase [Auritidibacter]|uniref:Phospholipase n=1 Tax=Auritidibacter ignavus TaxID=678932 RepID=A0AAJ6AIR7_9MICC|nr:MULTISPECIES: phospholipase [Auritidibacter]PXA77238.1 phospholipase [Auritidibacter sp. NML100628]WGH84801.1 phospholipase [Auritidibacter ignavus]WGH94236.1 phospholipase [Auritidibacter ignavus]